MLKCRIFKAFINGMSKYSHVPSHPYSYLKDFGDAKILRAPILTIRPLYLYLYQGATSISNGRPYSHPLEANSHLLNLVLHSLSTVSGLLVALLNFEVRPGFVITDSVQPQLSPFVSSDRSSYSDDGLLLAPTGALIVMMVYC